MAFEKIKRRRPGRLGLNGEISVFKDTAGNRCISVGIEDLDRIGVSIGDNIDIATEALAGELRVAIVSNGESFRVTKNGSNASGRITCSVFRDMLTDKSNGRYSVSLETALGRPALVFSLQQSFVRKTK